LTYGKSPKYLNSFLCLLLLLFVTATKANGRTIAFKESGRLNTTIEVITSANGNKINSPEKDDSNIFQVHSTMDSGNMIDNMGKVLKCSYSLIIQDMKDNL